MINIEFIALKWYFLIQSVIYLHLTELDNICHHYQQINKIAKVNPIKPTNVITVREYHGEVFPITDKLDIEQFKYMIACRESNFSYYGEKAYKAHSGYYLGKYQIDPKLWIYPKGWTEEQFLNSPYLQEQLMDELIEIYLKHLPVHNNQALLVAHSVGVFGAINLINNGTYLNKR